MKKKKLTEENKIIVESDIDLDASLGNAYREQYLQQYPRGYTAVTKSHKNKKKYNRKTKHKKFDE